jgi:hypothetical protein
MNGEGKQGSGGKGRGGRGGEGRGMEAYGRGGKQGKRRGALPGAPSLKGRAPPLSVGWLRACLQDCHGTRSLLRRSMVLQLKTIALPYIEQINSTALMNFNR